MFPATMPWPMTEIDVADALRGGGAARDDKKTRQGKQENDAMRGNVTTSWHTERRWQHQD